MKNIKKSVFFASQGSINYKIIFLFFWLREGFTGIVLINQTCTSSGFRMPANQAECEEIVRQLSLPNKMPEMMGWNSKDFQYKQYHRCNYLMPAPSSEEKGLRWITSSEDDSLYHDFGLDGETLHFCIEG